MAFKGILKKKIIYLHPIDDTNLFLNNMVSRDDEELLICTKLSLTSQTCSGSSCSKYISRYDHLILKLRYLVLRVKDDMG
jgi:hypothetical protein